MATTQLPNEITMPDRSLQPAATTTTTVHTNEEEVLNTAPPPPYTDADSDHDSDHDSEDWQPPQKLIINASRTITGHGNLVSATSPLALAEATKFSAALLSAVDSANAAAAGAGGQRRRLRIDLTINCGINVVGHKNVVGFGFKPNASPMPMPKTEEAVAAEVIFGAEAEAGAAVVGGAKRKADDEDTEAEQPGAKRVATDNTKPVSDELYDA